MSRNIVQSNNQYFEKIIRDKDGRLIRAKFFVYEAGGRIKARLVDFVYITAGEISGKVLSFANMSKKHFDTILNTLVFYLEPRNYNLETIFYLGSKPRAPTI